jgi:hypothetical protein
VGELIRFPGAEVDWTHVDEFQWTPELLADYREKAAALAHRYGGDESARLPRWPAGPPCRDCRQPTQRVRVRFYVPLLCMDCARARMRVAASEAA